MTWTTLQTWTTNQIITASDMNTDIRDNGNLTAPALVTTKGDVVAASGANATARVAVGANDTVFMADSAQTLGVKWAAFASSHQHNTAESEQSEFTSNDNGSAPRDLDDSDGQLTTAYTGYAKSIDATMAVADAASVDLVAVFTYTAGTNACTVSMEIRRDTTQLVEETQGLGSDTTPFAYIATVVQYFDSDPGAATYDYNARQKTDDSNSAFAISYGGSASEHIAST